MASIVFFAERIGISACRIAWCIFGHRSLRKIRIGVGLRSLGTGSSSSEEVEKIESSSSECVGMDDLVVL